MLIGSPPGGVLNAEQESMFGPQHPAMRGHLLQDQVHEQVWLDQAPHEVRPLCREGSRMRPAAPPLAPSLILSPRLSPPTILASWHRQEVVSPPLSLCPPHRMTLLILVSCCPAVGLSSPRPEPGLGKDTVAVLTWGQVWGEGGAAAHQMVELVLLEGQLPCHHGVEDDAPERTGSSGHVSP